MAEYIFKTFNKTEDVIPGKQTIKTFPIWTDLPSDVDTNPQATLLSMYTASAETGSWEANYYYNVYNQDATANLNAEVQFSLAFGTTCSIQLETPLGEEYQYTYPSRAVYAQFLSSLENSTIADANTHFSILKSGSSTTYEVMPVIYAISVARARIKDGIEADTWQLNLKGTGGTMGQYMTLVTSGSTTGAYRVPIITGKLSDYSTSTYPNPTVSASIQMGLFYPQHGVFILDAIKIDRYIGDGVAGYNPSIYTGSAATYAPSASLMNFWQMLKTGATSGSNSGSYFRARTTENVQSTHYFCRVKNYEYNYTTNPTWVSGSNNEILDNFYTEPRTFITTVGLYDGDESSGQLVAVAKLSRPIPKDGESEALIKVQLSF